MNILAFTDWVSILILHLLIQKGNWCYGLEHNGQDTVWKWKMFPTLSTATNFTVLQEMQYGQGFTVLSPVILQPLTFKLMSGCRMADDEAVTILHLPPHSYTYYALHLIHHMGKEGMHSVCMLV